MVFIKRNKMFINHFNFTIQFLECYHLLSFSNKVEKKYMNLSNNIFKFY